MLKNMKKSTKSNVITLGIVVGFYVLIQILSAAGALTNSFSGQLVPICAYVIMAVSLNLTVGMLGELSLGHAGFMSVGAFSGTLVYVVMSENAPQPLALLLAFVVGGAVALNDKETRDAVAFLQNAAGAVPSPFDSWLDIRGLKTLDLRVKQHSRNAMKVAQWLETRPEVERVWYPGLESHPGHDIAARQMHGGFGGMISIQIAAGFEAAKKFAGATEVFTLAESLGGVESLIEHPGAMTHASVAGTTLEVPANLIRLSVGLEDADDLIADLEQAFRQI